MTHMISKPLETLISPYKEGYLYPYKDRWWVITNHNKALFCGGLHNPQCNTNKERAKRLSDIANEQGFDTHIQFIPWIFVPCAPDFQ